MTREVSLSARVLGDELLTVEQVAALLHVAPGTVQDWVQRHLLPVTRVGRRVLFKAGDVRAYADAHYDLNVLGVRRRRGR